MPNYIDDGDFRKPASWRSTHGGATRKLRQQDPVYCEHEYPDAPDDEALCANLAVLHTVPPRCTDHGGVHAPFSRKRTEAGYVRVNPRMRKLLEGEISVTDLTTEELVSGRLLNSRGNFAGTDTQMVPRKMYAQMMNELFARANDKMKDSLVEAAELMTAVVKNADAEYKDRMKAAQWLIERVMGKMPETVNVQQDKPWQTLLMNVTAEEPEAYEAFVKQDSPDDDRF